jgi:hypothetical protein
MEIYDAYLFPTHLILIFSDFSSKNLTDKSKNTSKNKNSDIEKKFLVNLTNCYVKEESNFTYRGDCDVKSDSCNNGEEYLSFSLHHNYFFRTFAYLKNGSSGEGKVSKQGNEGKDCVSNTATAVTDIFSEIKKIISQNNKYNTNTNNYSNTISNKYNITLKDFEFDGFIGQGKFSTVHKAILLKT